MHKRYLPLALFDELKHIEKTSESVINRLAQERKNDYLKSVSFLKSYAGSIGTFNSYRREVEKLLHWSWGISQKSIKDLRRNDIENFIHFTQKPHKSWIGLKKATRFIKKMIYVSLIQNGALL